MSSGTNGKIEARFKLSKSTAGAHKYVEVNGQGKPLGMQEATIGTLYVRKNMMPTAKDEIVVTIQTH